MTAVTPARIFLFYPNLIGKSVLF